EEHLVHVSVYPDVLESDKIVLRASLIQPFRNAGIIDTVIGTFSGNGLARTLGSHDHAPRQIVRTDPKTTCDGKILENDEVVHDLMDVGARTVRVTERSMCEWGGHSASVCATGESRLLTPPARLTPVGRNAANWLACRAARSHFRSQYVKRPSPTTFVGPAPSYAPTYFS